MLTGGGIDFVKTNYPNIFYHREKLLVFDTRKNFHRANARFYFLYFTLIPPPHQRRGMKNRTRTHGERVHRNPKQQRVFEISLRVLILSFSFLSLILFLFSAGIESLVRYCRLFCFAFYLGLCFYSHGVVSRNNEGGIKR